MAEREQSFWGWGWADRFPGDEDRRQLAELVEGVLGFPERELLDPPRLASVDVPKPSLEPPAELDGFVTADREARIRRTYGRGYRDLVRGFHGDFSSAPDLVARPTSEADIEAVLAWASQQRVGVIPYGGGTSVVGGVEADVEDRFAGTLTLDVGAMDQVLEVDDVSRIARIQAGALGPALNEQLAEHGLTLRHYPQSYEFSTLGGWLATRAGGHFATVYTHIDDLTVSARMLTPSGPIETRRLPATGAGPDPKRLILGSEGALGVIAEGWMRVQPRPRYRSKASLGFEDWDAAVASTRAIVQGGLTPANCRLLDADEAMLNQVNMDGRHVLVLGFESPEHPTEPSLEEGLNVARDHGGALLGDPTHEAPGTDNDDGSEASAGARWRSRFLDAPYLFNQLVSLGVIVDTFETATTWDAFEDLHAAIQREVRAAMRDACGTGFLSTRFTHVYPEGPAPYYTLLAPADVGRELEQWRAIKRAASDVLIEHGATITHHHAVGRVHRPWYERETSPSLREALAAAKEVLDPAGIMNPGVLLA